MKKVKVSEATGPVLDWMVNEANGSGRQYLEHWNMGGDKRMVLCGIMNSPSKMWDQGGPIIEREKIGVWPPDLEHPYWTAGKEGVMQALTGPTPLIAAMRCYVASKLGDEVEVPGELG